RLLGFLNLGTFYPSRREFEGYLKWAAGQFEDVCSYAEQVTSIDPILSENNGIIEKLKVTSLRLSDNKPIVRTASNVILSIGGQPRLPDWAEPLLTSHPTRIFHSSQYLHRIRTSLPDPQLPYRIAIIGAGQSAAEIFVDLSTRYPNAFLTLIFRTDALRPADESSFVNSLVFNPESTDAFYFRKSEMEKKGMLERYKGTNYAVVNGELIERMYGMLYAQGLEEGGVERLGVWGGRVVVDARVDEGAGGGVVLYLRRAGLEEDGGDAGGGCGGGVGKGEPVPHVFDQVILATGYKRTLQRDVLKPLLPYLASSSASPPSTNGNADTKNIVVNELLQVPIGRDYRLATTPQLQAGVYLQGCCEDTHGLSDNLLSVLGVRGMEVVRSLIENDERLGEKLMRDPLWDGAGSMELGGVGGDARQLQTADENAQMIVECEEEVMCNACVGALQSSKTTTTTKPSQSPMEIFQGTHGSEWEWTTTTTSTNNVFDKNSKESKEEVKVTGVLRPRRPHRFLWKNPGLPLPGQTVYTAFAREIHQTVSFRVIDPVRDLDRFHSWMNSARVSYFWREQGTREHHEKYVRGMLEGGRCLPLVGCFDGKPFGYFEVYNPQDTVLGGLYGVDEVTGTVCCVSADDMIGTTLADEKVQGVRRMRDRGIHMLVGEERFRGAHRVRAWLPALVEYVFLACEEAEWVVAEPRIDNDKMVGYLEGVGRFAKVGKVSLPHKDAMLVAVH
ncbi:hypothetical protein HDV05_008818, partial [Chytridiales sp. JEL 0842]